MILVRAKTAISTLRVTRARGIRGFAPPNREKSRMHAVMLCERARYDGENGMGGSTTTYALRLGGRTGLHGVGYDPIKRPAYKFCKRASALSFITDATDAKQRPLPHRELIY